MMVSLSYSIRAWGTSGLADVASGDTGGLSVPVGLAREQRVGAPRGNCRHEFVAFVDKLSATRGKSKLRSCLYILYTSLNILTNIGGIGKTTFLYCGGYLFARRGNYLHPMHNPVSDLLL